MNNRILLYSLLLLLWVGMAVAIMLGFHEGILGRADASAKYIAIVICALMASFNVLRIYLIYKAARRSPSSSPMQPGAGSMDGAQTARSTDPGDSER